MTSVVIKLRESAARKGDWFLHSPKGHAISECFHGDKFKALEWAKAWISGWQGWTLQLDEGDNSDKEDKLPDSTVQKTTVQTRDP